MKITCRVVADIYEAERDKKLYSNDSVWEGLRFKDDEHFKVVFKLQILTVPKKDESIAILAEEEITNLEGITYIHFLSASYCYDFKRELLYTTNLERKI